MSVPGIGAKVADKILELREAKGDLELDDLNQVPYLRITQPLLDCLDFTSFENKEGMGSLYDRHRERVRSVDKLIGKWDGTGQGRERIPRTNIRVLYMHVLHIRPIPLIAARIPIQIVPSRSARQGGCYSPPRNTRGRWSRENTNPKMRESRGRTRHTLGRENEVPRIVQCRDEYDRERGHYRPIDKLTLFPLSPLTSLPLILLLSCIIARIFGFSSGGTPRPRREVE
jgi:hypothetical protein